MITEDYVSFEIAKLLKEKGFNERVKSYYTESGLEGYMLALKATKNTELDNGFISRPTIQTAMKWLRETHNLFVFPFPQMNTNKFWAEIYQLSNNQEWTNLYCETIDLEDYSSYEQACEAAIKYCLENLI